MLRSILAVVAGFAGWSVLWLIAGQVIGVVFPNAVNADGLIIDATALGVALAASIVCSLVAGLIDAAIDGRHTIASATVLGIILLIVGILVQASVWSAMPIWYHLSFLALLVPVTFAGARLRPSTLGRSIAAVAG